MLRPAAQGALFCGCGQLLPSMASCCRHYCQHLADSRRRFGGERATVRDGVVCGAHSARPHVHHRRSGCHERRWLATVCSGRHACLDKRATLGRGWLPPRLVELWTEQHPGAPVELEFPWESHT